jgi:hypothetical protein
MVLARSRQMAPARNHYRYGGRPALMSTVVHISEFHDDGGHLLQDDARDSLSRGLDYQMKMQDMRFDYNRKLSSSNPEACYMDTARPATTSK